MESKFDKGKNYSTSTSGLSYDHTGLEPGTQSVRRKEMKTERNFQVKSLSNIPRTGRIGRFAKILEKEVNEDVLVKIMRGSDKYNSLKPDKKALWWKKAIDNMENELGKENSISIMNACGEKCCGTGQRKIAKRIMNESNSLEEFLEKISKYKVKDGELVSSSQKLYQ
ncbi:MAG: hypothetical protein K8R40_07285 [Anaerolineaceae bacterium]|nr:hypothetical protein [Anaerolineaceae bacterium]